MSIENSAKLITEIADQRNADDYIEGLLKDPEMRADMERAERDAVASHPTIWEEAAQGLEIPQQQPSRENEMER